MSESDEEVLEVSEEFKDLFKGERIKFEGLSGETEEEYVKLVKEMGAEVSNDAQIIFMQRSYFEKKKNKSTNDILCNINYIADSVQVGKLIEMKDYIFIPDVPDKSDGQLLDDEPLCYAARFMYKTDSCQECYYKKVFCKECAKESIKESLKAANQKENHIISASHSSSKDEIVNRPDRAIKNSNKSSKRLMSSDSEQDSNDEEQIKPSCTKKSPIRKKLKNSSNIDNTCNREEYPKIKVENDSESNRSQSNGNSVNNFQNEHVEEASNGISGTASNSIKPGVLKWKRKNDVAETKQDYNISDDSSDNESNSKTNMHKILPQKDKGASYSSLITSSKPKLPVNNSRKEQVEEASNGIFVTAHNSIERRILQPSKSGVAEAKQGDNLSDDSSDNESNAKTNKHKKSLQKSKGASNSGYITFSKPKLTVKAEPLALSQPELLSNDVDENNYFNGNKWWLPQDVPVEKKCTRLFCSFEPTDHPSHDPPVKFLSLVEKKILVKYLIIKNAIGNAKGKLVYVNMINEGFLKHRTWETLRTCFRNTILKSIETYGLDQNLLNQFLRLKTANSTRVKKEK